jgi:hypothetical protein
VLGADPRSLEERPEVKYYVSNGEAGAAPEVLALVACTRHRVEEFFEDGKSFPGWPNMRRGRGPAGTTT